MYVREYLRELSLLPVLAVVVLGGALGLEAVVGSAGCLTPVCQGGDLISQPSDET